MSQLNSGQIIDSFSQGSVGGASGSSHGGLLATLGPASLVRTYSSAAVAQTSSAGALVGFDEGVPPTIVVDSFWDVSDSGLPTSADGTELTSTEMFQQSSFTNWDFTNVWQLNTGKEPTLRADADAAPLVATQSLNFPAGVTPNPITLSGFDFDGDSFTFSIVDAPSQGSLSAIVGDQLTYTPNANGANNDTFTFVATDVHGVASPLGVITINAPAVSP